MTRGNAFITQIKLNHKHRKNEMHNIITMYPIENNIEVHPHMASTTSIKNYKPAMKLPNV